mmetsp:Transcript_16269/g.63418  ORF Transcript_16269/g.63418 Transcript_16269/m.63418 type:complete len:730 (+) Transcript_16269:107-2296(+)
MSELEDVKRRFIGKFHRRKDEAKQKARRYWLVQSNPAAFSIDDLEDHPTKIVHWGAERNHEANKLLREMQEGDKVFFYHGKCEKPAIVGIVSVFRGAFPEERQWDKYDRLYDPASSQRKPIWFQVDIKFERKLSRPIQISELMLHAAKLDQFPLLSNPNIPVCELPLVNWTFVASLLLQAPREDILPGLDEIKPEEISIPSSMADGKVGEGAYGTVLKGLCRGKDVAVKIFFKKKLDQGALAAFDHEVGIVSSKHHPNIVQFLGICHMGDRMMLVTDYMPRGNLHDMLTDHSVEMSGFLRMQMARDVVLGMNWLHSSVPQVLHRDLKTKNLLIDENNRIKICDFGLSQIKAVGDTVFLHDGADGAKGTPLWMAPEVMMGRQFNEKADVYSFGIVLWEILTRAEPFQEFETFEQFRHAVCLEHARPQIPENCPSRLRTLIECCWLPNPERRPSFPEIVNALERIIVDCAITDEVGRRLWKERFLKREWVTWEQLEDAMYDVLDYYGDGASQPLKDNATPVELRMASLFQLNEYGSRSEMHKNVAEQEISRRRMGCEPIQSPADEAMQCLKALVVESRRRDGNEDVPIVTLETFGNMLTWFGPMVDVNTRKVILLKTMRDVLSEPWFHGDIGVEEAENRLLGRKDGTFLIRFSSIVGCYTISKIQGRVITHQRIIHKPGVGFSINYNTYHSLPDLVNYARADLQLAEACLGSRFGHIFTASPFQSGYIQTV